MNASVDYCELCDLPKAHCIHGRPEPAPVAKPAKASSRAQSPSRTRPAAKPRKATAAPTRTVSRRWTPPEVFRPVVLDVLREAGGELEADELFRRLEAVVDEHLRPGDREKTPEGELRWRYAARRARQALVADGLMARGRPGIWELTDEGRAEG